VTGTPEVYRPVEAQLGEGPCWHAALDALVWVDILRRHVHVSGAGEDRVYQTPFYPGAAVPTADGDLLLAMDGFATLDLETGRTAPVAPLDLGEGVRMNDAKCDPGGRFWAGTMALDASPGRGALYRLDGPGDVREMFAPVTVSNGLGWSPDRTTMYYIDTPTRSIRRFPFDVETGAIGEPAVIDTSGWSGDPDGMSVDADGNLWVAFWDGAAVRCVSPAGELLEEIALPVRRPTSCAFGGPRLARLMITTAREGLSEAELRDQPLAGSVLVVDPGVSGLPVTPSSLGA
jgi:sugar lactone lactonase YvrE